ncbi:hypothetical protein [Methylovulum sp.]|uniref:DUF6985 domain-containing protein n=1 Tax=Methylovulum sp. TaxID=1916980 RepID=UPI002631B007|nr:hypothetical protein [Methylovulum sp.]MDD5125385.1 hypothetical protein [Methylovulum sp.]
MQLRIGRKVLEITADEFENWSCHFVLTEWKGFQCENSRDDAIGENAFLVLRGDDECSPGEFDPSAYQSGLNWVIQNSAAIREAAMVSIFNYIHETLLGEYGLDDPDLRKVKRRESLKREIDPSYLHLFPHSKEGVPYFALEFECAWDPEHGCGVMFWGNSVVEVGVSDAAQGGFDIAGHGGKI